jgi:large subunit ribosomal protein L22
MGKQSAARKLDDNEAQAIVHNLRVSAQKLNVVAETIRGLDAAKAISSLMFSKRRIAGAVKKALESAIANAENNHQLDVKEAYVGKSMRMKRFRPRARGRVGKIEKPFSHLTVVVREREEQG